MEQTTSTPSSSTTTTPPYYFAERPPDRPNARVREMLISHARLDPDEVDQHLYQIRDKAWRIFPYPCIGLWSFLITHIDDVDIYPALLQRLKSSTNRFVADEEAASSDEKCRILDAATGLGQDSRRLLHDGVAASQLYAADIEPGFWSLSFDLWRDAASFASTAAHFSCFDFTSQTMLDDAKNARRGWKGSFDFIFVGHLFHLLSYEDTITAASNLARLTRGPGAEILLWQLGGTGQEVCFEMGAKKYQFFLANEQSLKQVWEVEVPTRTGLQFEVLQSWAKKLPYTPGSEDWPKWLPRQGCMFEGWIKRIS